MALELLYNAIRLTNGDNTPISAVIKDNDGVPITTGDMKLIIPDIGLSITGIYENGVWSFEVPSNPNIKGRYMYLFEYNGTYLEFEAPIYFEWGEIIGSWNPSKKPNNRVCLFDILLLNKHNKILEAMYKNFKSC